MTFILAMTVMYFSTCHSQVRIIPRVICFVLPALQSLGTYRRRRRRAADSTKKPTRTGDSSIKQEDVQKSASYVIMGQLLLQSYIFRYILSSHNVMRHNNYTEITILNPSLIITLLSTRFKSATNAGNKGGQRI